MLTVLRASERLRMNPQTIGRNVKTPRPISIGAINAQKAMRSSHFRFFHHGTCVTCAALALTEGLPPLHASKLVCGNHVCRGVDLEAEDSSARSVSTREGCPAARQTAPPDNECYWR